MLKFKYHRTLALALLVSALGASTAEAYKVRPLFSNRYSNGPGTDAKLYVAPLPVPEWVGHTYTTYQPLQPSEWLNPHSRRYFRFDGHPLPVNYTRVEHW